MYMNMLRTDDGTGNKIKEQAEKEGRSVNNFLIYVIKKYLEEIEKSDNNKNKGV